MANNINLIITYTLSLILFSSCGEKFNKANWDDYDHLDGSDRSSMAKDLVENHKLIGLSYKQMVNLLNLPENDTTETWYSLKEEYPFLGIDPESGKNFIIKFNKDSIITSAKIEEWHKH